MLQRGRRRLRRGSANGGAPPWWRYSVILGLGRVGRRVGGRRKPVHGGLAAASMPRTPPPRLPTRPWTVSCGVHHGKSQTRAKAGRFARKAEPASQPPLLLPLLLPFSLDLPVVVRLPESVWGRAGGVGGVSAAWMPRLSPHGRVHGVPANPTRPAHPQEPSFQRPTQPHHGGAPPFADSRRRRAFRARKKFPTDVSIPSPLVRCTQ